MASCKSCRRTIILGGLTVGSFRYCSRDCAEKGALISAGPDAPTLPPIHPLWTVLWAVIAICATGINYIIDLAGMPKSVNPGTAVSMAFGYALGPYLVAVVLSTPVNFDPPSAGIN